MACLQYIIHGSVDLKVNAAITFDFSDIHDESKTYFQGIIAILILVVAQYLTAEINTRVVKAGTDTQTNRLL